MEQSEIEDAAMFLLHLHTQNTQAAGLPGELAPKTIDEAYDIQDALHRYGGWQISMIKVGLTSDFAQELMGVPHPAGGRIQADTIHPSGAELAVSDLGGAPMIEGEFALRVGPDGVPDAVAPAIELVGGRFKPGAKISGPSLIADNVSARAVVLGEPIPINDAAALLDAPIELFADGERLATATGAAINGGPAASLAWVLEHEASRGRTVAEGTWVITGTCTGMTPAKVGTTYSADYGNLGSISFSLTS